MLCFVLQLQKWSGDFFLNKKKKKKIPRKTKTEMGDEGNKDKSKNPKTPF